MQCPSFDKLPFMDLSSASRIYLSVCVRSEGMLNFSEPAKSTILSYDESISTLDTTISYSPGCLLGTSFSHFTWNMEWERELLIFPEVEQVTLFLSPSAM